MAALALLTPSTITPMETMNIKMLGASIGFTTRVMILGLELTLITTHGTLMMQVTNAIMSQ